MVKAAATLAHKRSPPNKLEENESPHQDPPSRLGLGGGRIGMDTCLRERAQEAARGGGRATDDVGYADVTIYEHFSLFSNCSSSLFSSVVPRFILYYPVTD